MTYSPSKFTKMDDLFTDLNPHERIISETAVMRLKKAVVCNECLRSEFFRYLGGELGFDKIILELSDYQLSKRNSSLTYSPGSRCSSPVRTSTPPLTRSSARPSRSSSPISFSHQSSPKLGANSKYDVLSEIDPKQLNSKQIPLMHHDKCVDKYIFDDKSLLWINTHRELVNKKRLFDVFLADGDNLIYLPEIYEDYYWLQQELSNGWFSYEYTGATEEQKKFTYDYLSYALDQIDNNH